MLSEFGHAFHVPLYAPIRHNKGVLWYLSPRCQQHILSPVKCKVGPPWIRLVCPTHPPDARLDRNLDRLKPFLNHFCFVAWCIILLKEATTIREYRFHERVYMVCNNAKVGGICQSNIHMGGRTQGFPPQHCPKHHTASAGLPSSRSASWRHVFPR